MIAKCTWKRKGQCPGHFEEENQGQGICRIKYQITQNGISEDSVHR